MAELFLDTVNRSISASWLVLAVVALRFALKKAPKWVNVLLWGLVAFRLVCPVTLESTLSLIPSAETIPMEIMMDATPEIHTGIAAVNSVVNPVITETFAPDPVASANPLQILIPVLALVWCIGMALMVLYTLVSYWHLRRRVQTAVRLKDNIYQSENVVSPFVLGIFRPRIYLPFHMPEADMYHVIAHEQTHIRRKDHWWKPMGFLLLTLHWFNPVMRAAYLLLCRDIELACDEKVIKELGVDQRADYSQALLHCSVSRRSIAACPIAFGEVGVKQRVKNVLNYKKPAFWVILIAVLLCIVVAMCFLTSPRDSDSLEWLQNLKAEDVNVIQYNFTPGDLNGGETIFYEQETYPDLLAFLNQASGKRVTKPWRSTGGLTLYLLFTKDDGIIQVKNVDNTYLVIDGDYYEADPDWLRSWPFREDGALPTQYTEPVRSIVGQFYAAAETVYHDPRFSSTWPYASDQPYCAITYDCQLLSLESNTWVNRGILQETELTEETFDTFFQSSFDQAPGFREENANCWQLIYNVENVKNPFLLYLMRQNDGTLYLAYGYYDAAGTSLIRWLHRLETVPAPDWDVTMKVETVTPTGASISLTPSVPLLGGELEYESDYALERYENGEWDAVERKGSANWSGSSYYLKDFVTVSHDLDWSELYGELPEGQYRIVKIIKLRTRTEATTTYNSHRVYAEFTLAK